MKKQPSPRINFSIYESAPDMLLDKIAEINGILAKQKAKTGETESYLFWARVAEVMKFAWDYFQDLKWIMRKNELLMVENEYLRNWNLEVEKRLKAYEIIRELKISNKFEEAVERVDTILAKGDQQLNHEILNRGND